MVEAPLSSLFDLSVDSVGLLLIATRQGGIRETKPGFQLVLEAAVLICEGQALFQGCTTAGITEGETSGAEEGEGHAEQPRVAAPPEGLDRLAQRRLRLPVLLSAVEQPPDAYRLDRRAKRVPRVKHEPARLLQRPEGLEQMLLG